MSNKITSYTKQCNGSVIITGTNKTYISPNSQAASKTSIKCFSKSALSSIRAVYTTFNPLKVSGNYIYHRL